MKYDLRSLYVNMPPWKDGRLFDLPDDVYTDEVEAIKAQKGDEYTCTLQDAFERIAADIHEDS